MFNSTVSEESKELVEKTGAGRSASENTIPEREEFGSGFASTTVTKKCVKARDMSIVDTPSLVTVMKTEKTGKRKEKTKRQKQIEKKRRQWKENMPRAKRQLEERPTKKKRRAVDENGD